MASSVTEYDEHDCLHQIVRAVYQETIAGLNNPPSPPPAAAPEERPALHPRSYKAKQSQVRKVGRTTARLSKTTIDSSPELLSEHGDLVDVPSNSSYSKPERPALKKRKASKPLSQPRCVSTRSPQSTAIPLSSPSFSDNQGDNLPVSVTLASGLDPVSITSLVPVSLADISTVAKIRSMVSTEYAADLAAFASPEELRVLAYRFKVSGEDEWTAITSPQELREELKLLKQVDLETKIVRMQVCLVEGDEEGVGDRPLLLGKAVAAAKKLKAMGGGARKANEGPASEHEDVGVDSSDGETTDEDAMVTISRKEYDSLKQTKRDLKDTLGFLAQSLEVMASMPGAADNNGATDVSGEQDEAGENNSGEGATTTVAGEDDEEDDGIEEAVRRVTHATRMLAERTGFRFE